MKLINLTPHKINIFDKDGILQLVILEPSGAIARLNESEVYIENLKFEGDINLPIYVADSPTITGIPDPTDELVLVVSTPVRLILKDRGDIASPGELIRNKLGQPIGCKGLVFNKFFPINKLNEIQ